MKHILVIILSFLLISCNQSEVKELKKENSSLSFDIMKMEKRIRLLEDLNEGLHRENKEMLQDLQEIQVYASSASSHMSNAIFWYGESKFHFTNSIKQIESDFNNIIYICYLVTCCVINSI